MFKNLPKELNMLIWDFDPTYREIYNDIIKNEVNDFRLIFYQNLMSGIKKKFCKNVSWEFIKDLDLNNKIDYLRYEILINMFHLFFYKLAVPNYKNIDELVNFYFNNIFEIETFEHSNNRINHKLTITNRNNKNDVKTITFFIDTKKRVQRKTLNKDEYEHLGYDKAEGKTFNLYKKL